MKCQRCQSTRVLEIRSRGKDMHTYRLGEYVAEQSYAMDFSSDGDTTEIEVCLDCGQTQGEFPMKSALEQETT